MSEMTNDEEVFYTNRIKGHLLSAAAQDVEQLITKLVEEVILNSGEESALFFTSYKGINYTYSPYDTTNDANYHICMPDKFIPRMESILALKRDFKEVKVQVEAFLRRVFNKAIVVNDAYALMTDSIRPHVGPIPNGFPMLSHEHIQIFQANNKTYIETIEQMIVINLLLRP